MPLLLLLPPVRGMRGAVRRRPGAVESRLLLLLQREGKKKKEDADVLSCGRREEGNDRKRDSTGPPLFYLKGAALFADQRGTPERKGGKKVRRSPFQKEGGQR